MNDITQVLDAINRGESQAAEQLLPLVYEELRHLAAARMARESAGHTLQPTALVHEAWVRLNEGKVQAWENRGHFFGAAAEAMRRILIDHARFKSRIKHGGGKERVNIEDYDIATALPDDKLLLVDEALERLKVEDPETAQVVVLKFFGGLNNAEIAEFTGTSDRTIRRQWQFAKAWLFDAISKNR